MKHYINCINHKDNSDLFYCTVIFYYKLSYLENLWGGYRSSLTSTAGIRTLAHQCFHITLSHVCSACFDVHFYAFSPTVCCIFPFVCFFFFFFVAQSPFQRAISTNWRTVGSRVRRNHSKPPFLRLDHPCLFIPFFPILCLIWISNPDLSTQSF